MTDRVRGRRRQWNQALFLRLLVHDKDIHEAEIAEPFATLATPGLADELDRHEQEPRDTQGQSQQDSSAALNGGGSNKGQIVGAITSKPSNHGHFRGSATRLQPKLGAQIGRSADRDQAEAEVHRRCAVLLGERA